MNTLDTLIHALTNLEDNTVCKALADAMEEQGHQHAADIRHLADVVPVVPVAKPRYLQTGEASIWLQEMEVHGLDCTPELLPMACGPWWSIDHRPEGVFERTHSGAPQSHMVLLANLPVGFEFCRRLLIAGVLGWRLECDDEYDVLDDLLKVLNVRISYTEMEDFQFTSNAMFYTPGFLLSEQARYRESGDPDSVVRHWMVGYSLSERCADDLLSGSINYQVVGDTVVFRYRKDGFVHKTPEEREREMQEALADF